MNEIDELLDEWDRLSEAFNKHRCTPELSARWLEIWNTYIAVQDPNLVNNCVVALYSSLGWKMSAEVNDWDTAADRLSFYSRFPCTSTMNTAMLTC